jgi:flagella basal body P-ring formation protein FlgA
MKLLKKILIAVILLSFGYSPVSGDDAPGDLIVRRMMETYDLDSGCYEIEILSNQLEDQVLVDTSLTIRALSQKEPLGLFTVMAAVAKNGQELAGGQVRMRIHKYADVVVASDRIVRNEELDTSRFIIQRMEVTNLIEQPLTDLAELANYRAKRNLRMGTIVTSSAIEAIPDIERGHETVIVYDDGYCHITAPGVALQSGSVGEYIKVKNKATRKIIIARVIDDGEVAVDP